MSKHMWLWGGECGNDKKYYLSLTSLFLLLSSALLLPSCVIFLHRAALDAAMRHDHLLQWAKDAKAQHINQENRDEKMGMYDSSFGICDDGIGTGN